MQVFHSQSISYGDRNLNTDAKVSYNILFLACLIVEIYVVLSNAVRNYSSSSRSPPLRSLLHFLNAKVKISSIYGCFNRRFGNFES
jgi:hypothetical protein